MIERFTDLEKIDTFPEIVQEVIHSYEGKELVKIEHIKPEGCDSRWNIVFYEPLIQGEESPFDDFYFATVYIDEWPEEKKTSAYYFSLERCELAEVWHFKSKRKHVDIEGVA